MFEYLLEKLLNQFLGQFIDGFDSQNLHIGIWSGEVTIQNVSVKPEIVKMLELPLRICFSHIGKLKLNVPWKSLQSSPVEVNLSDLYLVISAEHPDDWKFVDFAGFKKKLEILEKFKESIIQNIANQSKQSNENQPGYITKLVLKIIDNIQLSISNIHIRFEDTIKNEFAWGFTVKNIEAFTCNSEWKKQFYDRNLKENKAVPLQKLLQLVNIGAYWNQNETDFMHSKEKQVVLQKMEELIISQQDPKTHPKYSQFILLLNAQGRLFQNTSGKFDQPEYSFSIDLNTIDLAIENLQLQQIIRMAELFSLYQNRLNKQKKQKLLLSEKQIEDQKLIFLSLYEKILRSPDQSSKILTKDENDLFEQSVSNLSIEILCDSAKEIIKVVQKEIAIKEAEEKKKKSGGWFSWGKKKENDIIDQKEKDELSKFIDQLADFEVTLNIIRPADYIWLAIQFSLQSGSVHILKQFESKREGVQLTYSGFSGNVEVKDAGMKVNLGLQYIGIDILSEPIKNGIVMYTEQKRIVFLEQTNHQKFIDFSFETNPDHHKGYDKYIKLQTGSLKLIFNPVILLRISQFTDFQIKDESIKNAAWDQVELAQDMAANQMAQSQLSPSKLFIDVTIKSTIVLVPIPDTTENWMVNLGDVQIVTPQSEEINYDHFEITLQDFTLKHYKQIQTCHDSIVKGIYLENLDGSYSVIQNFKVSIVAQILRGSAKAPITKPLIIIKGVLPELHLFVSPLIYGRILKIGDCFLEPASEQEEVLKRQNRLSIEKAQTERTVLMNNATKVGKIWKRGQLLTWSQYTSVLSGGYIYLFAKPKDQQPESYFWIRNSDFEDVSEQEAGMANAFYVKNKYAETLIAFDKPKLAKDWKDAIEALRTIPRVEKNDDEYQVVSTEVQQQKKENRPMQFQFEVRGFGLHIQDEALKDWLNVGISGLMASAQLLNGSIDLDLKLRDLYVTDNVQIYLNPLLKYIVKSDPDPQSNELISINVQQINNKDARYDKKNLIVNVTFGTLSVIAKPLVVAKLLVFVTPPQSNNEMQVYEQIDEEKLKRDQAKKDLEKNAQQQQVNLESGKNIILMDVTVTIRSINAILVHRFTTLPLAQINIQNTEIGLIKYVDELQLKGSLGNLQLFDLTNYPNTLSKESDYTLIVPQQMIGVKYAQQSLLRVKLKLFTEGSNKIKDNVNIIISVDMSELIIHVMMQPVLRLLDYTLQQLLFALSNPNQTINPQEDVMEVQDEEIIQYQQQRESKKKTTILLTEEEQQYLQKQLINPPAMKLNVIINNPQVILKPNQESQSAMVINLGTIVVTNKRAKVTNRIDSKDELLDGVWVDNFILNMKDIQIYQQNSDNKREFSLPFDFNVSVEIFGMAQQYQLQYPKIRFDEQLKIYSFTAPMILQMTHSDYMFLMKCLFHNIAYDDGFDNMIRKNNPQYFKAFFLQQQQQEIKQREMLLAQKENPQLSFQLDMENFTVFLLKDIEPKPTPFLRMMLVMQRVTFIKCQNGTAKVGLTIRDMEGSMFATDPLGQYNELPFIGRMNINQVYSYEQVTNLTGLVRGRQGLTSNAGQALNLACCGQLSYGDDRVKIFKFEDAPQFKVEELVSYKLAFGLSMKVSGDKDMNVDLSDFKLQVHVGPLFEILALIAMDDPNLTPSPGKYAEVQQLQQQNVLQQQEKPELEQQQQQQGYLKINVNLRNVITCIPTKVEQNILTIKGIFDISLVMSPKKTLQQVKKEINENNIPEANWEKVNETMMIGAKLQKLEIFLCKSYDLSKKDDFKQVKKREILNPIDIEVIYSQTSALERHMLGFIDLQIINGKISPVSLKVSFKDLVTIKDGLNYQLSQMPKQDEKKEEQHKNNNELSKLDASHLNNLQMRSMRIDFRIAGTKVVVLNDMGNSFTPLFEYEMEEIIASLVQNNIFIQIKVELPFRLSNFNPLCSKWEPIIERTGFVVEIYQSQIKGLGGQTNNLITVEQMEEYDNFNITLSTNCIQTILRALKIIEIMFKKVDEDNLQSISKSFVQVEDDKSQSEENVIQVSPYAIRNLTGYPLVVECIDNPRIPLCQVQINQQQNLILEEELEILSANKQKRVNVTIKMEGRQFPIKLIDIDKTKSRFYQCDDKKIFCSVKLDQVTNQKILTIQSSIVIVNKTSKNILLQLNDSKHSQTLKLTSGKSEQEITHITPVPILFQDTKIALKTSDCPQYSDEISLESLLRQKELIHEIETRDGLHFILKIYEDKEFNDKIKIELQTPYKITNSLPKDIYIQMLNQNKETTFTKKLLAGQSIEDYQHSQNKQTYLRILLQGYYWSDEYKLNYYEENKKQKEDCLNKITIYDAYNVKTQLLVFEPQRQADYDKSTKEFVFHCQGYIMNECGLQLNYFTNEKKKDMFPVGGQDSINNGDFIDKNMLFLSNDSGSLLSLSHKSASSKTSQFPIEISSIGEPQIDVIKVDDEGDQAKLIQVYLGAKISLNQCNNKYSLFNKVIILEPRFILVNNSDKTLMITSNNWQYYQTIEPDTRKIYQVQYEPKNNVRDLQQFINLRLSEDKYDFQGRINISAIGIVYFQVRNRVQADEKLYFSCDTRKEGSSIYAIFTHIPQEKAPYKIQLAVDNFELSLYDLGVVLKAENPEVFFAWDDPQQLQRYINADLRVRDDPYSDYTPFKYKLSPDYIGLFKVYGFRPKKGSKAPVIYIALTILPEGNQKQVKISLATEDQIKKSKSKPKQDFLKQAKEKNDQGIGFNEDEESDRYSQSLSLSRQSTMNEGDKIDNRINLKLNSISISMVHNADVKKRPSEFFHFTFKNLEFVRVVTDLSEVYQLRVQYVNFDHNAQFFVCFPVIMTPQKYAIYNPVQKQIKEQKQNDQSQQSLKQQNEPVANEKYFFNVMVMKDVKVSDITLLQNLTLEIDPFEIKIEQLFITNLLDFIWSITEFNKNVENFEKSQHSSFFSQKESGILKQQEEEKQVERKNTEQIQPESAISVQEQWRVKKLPDAQLATYISEVIISPISINLTFQVSGKADLQISQNAIISSIAQALGVALSDIDNAPIFFQGQKLDNYFDNLEGFKNKMISKYQSELIKQIGKLVGSLSIIGNPIGLFNNVSTGFKDFVDKPAEGLTKGPLEAGLGLAQGAGSLVSHTMAGAFNSLNKITGSVGSGLANLSMDEEYLKKREKMKMKKPKHLGQGFGQGAESIMTGLTDGLTGVFLKPFKGAKEGGVGGFLKGTAQGFAGLIIKPVTGVFDGISQAAAGVQNTFSYFDDKPNSNRARNIRPVYGVDGYLSDFNSIDGEAFAMIHFLKNGTLMNNRFEKAFLLIPDLKEPENKFMVVLTIENFIYMSFKTKKKVWILVTTDITSLELLPSGIKIQVNKPQKQLKNKYVTQIIVGDDQKDVLFQKMYQVWNQQKKIEN